MKTATNKMHNDDVEKWNIRSARPEDHSRIIAVLPDRWDGRDLTSMVPKVFASFSYHFADRGSFGYIDCLSHRFRFKISLAKGPRTDWYRRFFEEIEPF